MAGELSRRGSMKGLSEGLGLRIGKLSHVLTRAVGIESEVQPDWKKVDLREGDWILICSDGVYDMVSDEGIREAFAAGGRAEDVAARLERKTLDGGAVDNYTMVVVKVGGMR